MKDIYNKIKATFNQEKINSIKSSYLKKNKGNFKTKILKASTAFFKNFFNFKGRTSQEEFLFTLPLLLILSPFLTSFLLIPALSLVVRRLHDINFSGWWSLLYFTGAGSFIPFILNLLPKENNLSLYENKYGIDPEINEEIYLNHENKIKHSDIEQDNFHKVKKPKSFHQSSQSIHKKKKFGASKATNINHEEITKRLEKLKDLLDRGIINQAEFNQKKQDLLEKM